MITLSFSDIFAIVFYVFASIFILYMFFTLLRDNILKYYSSRSVDDMKDKNHKD